ncbi:hypothetical protein EV421DRAFT_1909344 [Armillaria borealis]|uniref:Uncharacterized protein n=1 Tax=Armillaria borealis TaxID=47425 RepID=A0AA39J2P5_9AGAR|nr:hypothetical protein EV421DRAFT_1909344 [Armillaria borealis]
MLAASPVVTGSLKDDLEGQTPRLLRGLRRRRRRIEEGCTGEREGEGCEEVTLEVGIVLSFCYPHAGSKLFYVHATSANSSRAPSITMYDTDDTVESSRPLSLWDALNEHLLDCVVEEKVEDVHRRACIKLCMSLDLPAFTYQGKEHQNVARNLDSRTPGLSSL